MTTGPSSSDSSSADLGVVEKRRVLDEAADDLHGAPAIPAP